MTTRREFLAAAPAVAVAGGILAVPRRARAQGATSWTADPWHSPSLTEHTIVAWNGAVTTGAAGEFNARWGKTDKRATEVADGVWLLSGWGIANSMAVQAPGGWIIIDTGDSTRAAAEMRERLEQAVGEKIRVAAILLTHWHYADGTAAWLDEGTEIWGHERLDATRRASVGASVRRGVFLARAIAQFGVLHPTEGPDAFPNVMGFAPEKFTAESSYQPPTRLFKDGQIQTFTIAGEQVEVGPNRSDTADSVGFYFPARRLLITNFMAPVVIFNIYSLRGGSYRDPAPFIEDARWMESKDAEILLDLHAAAVTGEDAVRDAIQRAADQVQLIHDQTQRMIAHGMDGREAAENVYMPAHLRGDWETYGQVESHVRQVYNGTMGWFGHDVYDINPLSLREEAARTIQMSGGPEAVREAAAAAVEEGGFANWRWALKLTSLLLRLDPQDADARQARAAAARALGQRTRSSNARGWYITEALNLEGNLRIEGRPVTMDMARAVLGTPSVQALLESPVEANLEFLRFLVDPRAAEHKRISFTLGVSGEPQIWRLELRNSVLAIGPVDARSSPHIELTRRELAEFVLGLRPLAEASPALRDFEASLDRSHFVFLPGGLGAAFDEPDETARLLADSEQ